MNSASTNDRYGNVAAAIHWVSVVAIAILIASGFAAASADPAVKAAILRAHVPLGLMIGIVSVARLAWLWGAGRRPAPLSDAPRWQTLAAHAVHGLLYVVIFGLVASGIGMMALSGAGTVLFGNARTALPDFWAYAPRIPHGIGARLMLALVTLHVAAALHHQFVRRDGLLTRMWFVR